MTKTVKLQNALRTLPTHDLATVTYVRGQGFFARVGYTTLFFQTFEVGMRFVDQVRTTGRANMSDLRIR